MQIKKTEKAKGTRNGRRRKNCDVKRKKESKTINGGHPARKTVQFLEINGVRRSRRGGSACSEYTRMCEIVDEEKDTIDRKLREEHAFECGVRVRTACFFEGGTYDRRWRSPCTNPAGAAETDL